MNSRSLFIITYLVSAALLAPFAQSNDGKGTGQEKGTSRGEGEDVPEVAPAEEEAGDEPETKKEEKKGVELDLFSKGVKHWKVLDDLMNIERTIDNQNTVIIHSFITICDENQGGVR